MAKYCTQCGQLCDESAKACPSCGAFFENAQASAPTPQPAQPQYKSAVPMNNEVKPKVATPDRQPVYGEPQDNKHMGLGIGVVVGIAVLIIALIVLAIIFIPKLIKGFTADKSKSANTNVIVERLSPDFQTTHTLFIGN